MAKQKSQAFTEAIVGLFMVAVILMLGYFTIVISGVDVLKGDERVAIRIVFDQVGGLKDHDNVMYRGTKVGAVEDVDVTPSNLVVTAFVDKDVILRTGAMITVCNLSMLGGNYLLLEEGEGEILDLKTTLFAGRTPTDWMKDLTTLANNLRAYSEMTEFREIVTNVAEVARNVRAYSEMKEIEQIVTNVAEVARNVRAYSEMYEVRNIITNASVVSERVRSMSEKGDVFMDRANAIAERLDRQKLYDDLEAGIAAFRKAAESFDANETKQKANELLDNLNAVAVKLRNGDGTLGKLANDPEMYERINGLIKDCRQVLDNYRDTTPIATFSSLATGAL